MGILIRSRFYFPLPVSTLLWRHSSPLSYYTRGGGYEFPPCVCVAFIPHSDYPTTIDCSTALLPYFYSFKPPPSALEFPSSLHFSLSPPKKPHPTPHDNFRLLATDEKHTLKIVIQEDPLSIFFSFTTTTTTTSIVVL